MRGSPRSTFIYQRRSKSKGTAPSLLLAHISSMVMVMRIMISAYCFLISRVRLMHPGDLTRPHPCINGDPPSV
jgi:hypothetical protein